MGFIIHGNFLYISLNNPYKPNHRCVSRKLTSDTSEVDTVTTVSKNKAGLTAGRF